MEAPTPFRVLFICLGNICRSPLAERILQHEARKAGFPLLYVDSAGTGAWHVGEAPDPRSVAAADRYGIEVKGSARTVRTEDFSTFDLILAMDRDNLRSLQQLGEGARRTAELALLRDFDPESEGDLDVPDPYYGGPDGFDRVFDIIHRSCLVLLKELRERVEG